MNGIAQTSDRIESDPLAKTIVSMINAMQADYGQVFTKQFSDSEILKNYKRRLYQKLKGLPIESIIDGYELCVDQNLKFCPTIPEVAANVLEAVKRSKRTESNKAEADRVAALPPPKITECNPSKLLVEALSKASDKKDKAAWMARKAELIKNHNAVLVLYNKFDHGNADSEHDCVISGCRTAGSMSNGTKGSGNFYCSKHFKTAG
jgi:hypothetical protein